MLSVKQIHQQVHSRAHRRLTQRILANGRCQSPRILKRLLEPGAAAPAALGLALQRLFELTWGSSTESRLILSRLLACQAIGGLFGDPDLISGDGRNGDVGKFVSIAATAVAVRTLTIAFDRMGSHDFEERFTDLPRLKASQERATTALTRSLKASNSDDFNDVDAAIVLWQLGDLKPLARNLGLDHLAVRLKKRAGLEHCGELFEYAYSSAA